MAYPNEDRLKRFRGERRFRGSEESEGSELQSGYVLL
jgi:hypothetical protein